jgi:hypothetical protein
MPRYRPANARQPDDTALPLDSLAVVIPRQSKKGGAGDLAWLPCASGADRQARYGDLGQYDHDRRSPGAL